MMDVLVGQLASQRRKGPYFPKTYVRPRFESGIQSILWGRQHGHVLAFVSYVPFLFFLFNVSKWCAFRAVSPSVVANLYPLHDVPLGFPPGQPGAVKYLW